MGNCGTMPCCPEKKLKGGNLFHDPRLAAIMCVYSSVAIDFLGMAIVYPVR